ncbi:MROH1 protein, partial [Acromyrmex heyeri]
MKEELEENYNSELSAVIGALLDTLNDKNQDVKQSVIESIERISKKNPEVVIHAAIYFWEMHKKISTEHMGSLLNIISSICRHSTTSLTVDLVTSLAEVAVNELIGETENEAAELLIELCKIHCMQATGGLLTKLEPGVIPNPAIVFTIGKLAAANPYGMLSFVKITLTIMLPMLNQIREEILKQAICFMISKFGEAINDYIMNGEDSSLGINKQTFVEEICSVFDFLINNWLKTSRDSKSTEAILTTLVPMVSLLPVQQDSERIVKLIPVCLNLCRKQNVRLAAVRVIAMILSSVETENDKEAIRAFMEIIHQTLSEFVSICPFEAARDAVLTHYEVLQCSRSLVVLYPEEGLDRILQQLKSPIAHQRARALVVLRHLINTLPSEMYIVNMYIVLLVSHCEIKSDDMEACSEALYLLATTVDGVESWLWPCLISALLDSACIASITSVLRSLSPLAVKIIRDKNSSTNERDFPGTKVLGRCLELLSNPVNRPAIIAFLKSAAPLIGHQVKPYWDEKLHELSQEFLHDRRNSRRSSKEMKDAMQWDLIWEKKIVEWLEESVKLEGESWGTKLADELALKVNTLGVAPLLASTCNNNAHITLLVELARSHGTTKEFARAVGICAKRHLSIVLKLMEEFCTVEDARKAPVRLLGFVKDTKAAATAEAAKAGLLQSYAEIAQKGDPQELFPVFEKHVLPWTIKQLQECKELSTKEAGLSVLEQVVTRLSRGFFSNLSTVILGNNNLLNNEERQIFLGAVLDKTISASSEIALQLHPEIMQQVIDELGTVSSEIVSDSADALSELVDILLPWMQSKSIVERKITLLVLHTVLQSYYNSLKYTYPGGKLDAGKLVGRTLCWCADTEFALRPLAIDCMLLSLDIAARHRHISPDNALSEDIQQIKKELMIEDSSVPYGAVERLANAVSQKIPNGEIVSLAEGLIEGLLFYGEASLVAGIALSQHFQIKGSEISRTDVCLVESIIAQMRQMENASCRYTATVAVVSLMRHHPEEVIEYLLSQPLPLDPGTALCWKEIGNNDFLGPRALDMLLIKLESGNLFSDIPLPSMHSGRNNIASLSSLAAIIGLKHFLESPHVESLITDTQLAGLLSVLLKYLSGWLHVEAPASVINTKYGYVPNRAAQKINPHTEVYSILTNILIITQPNAASNLPMETTFASEAQAEESLISTVRILMKCISTKTEVLSNMTQYLGKLMTSTIAIQRAVAATFYSELIGKINCGTIWLDAIINTLHDAKADSSSLVRKLATIGLARIAYLDPRQVDEYFDNCMEALLDGLEETAGGEGGAEVVLESLRGLSVLLSVQYKRPISPRVVLALKPFIEKENWEMKLAAIDALGAIATNWQRSVALPDDDLIDHLLGCLPSLIIRLEDSNITVVKTAQETLCKTTSIVQNEKLLHVIRINLGPQAKFSFENFSKDLINCLKKEFPQRAEELRNAVVRGYSRSENYHTRATSALLLGLFDSPRPEDVQRLLQLLRDRESIVRMRASKALSFCFTL